MKLITKMTVLVVVLLSITLLIAVLGITSMGRVGSDLRVIAEADIPFLGEITKTALAQQKQSVWIERALMAAEMSDVEDFRLANDKIERLEREIDGRFKASFTYLNKFLASAETEELKQDYQSLTKRLSDIEAEYADYIESMRELLGFMDKGDIARGDIDISGTRQQIQYMTGLLQALTTDMGRVTLNTARLGKEKEASASRTMVVVSVVSFIVALILGVWIVRGVGKQLGNDPAVLVNIAEALATGDLEVERDNTAVGAYGSISQTVDRLVEIIRGIKIGANEVNEASEQVSMGNANLSQRTQEQASSLEEVASSMEEMISTVNQNAENAQQANQLASAARQQADKGGAVVSKAVLAMNDISDSSKKIADIIGVIDEIAFQTNLLALNAAVEAARAGEQGRGFAVVASEVRNLAGRSATAAKEIKELIHDSVEKVVDGTTLVDQSGEALEEIVNSVKKVSDIVAEIAAASQEQSDGIGQVNKALLQMDEMTQQNASLVEEAAAASEAMGAQAHELSALVSYFKIEKDDTVKTGEVQRLGVAEQDEAQAEIEIRHEPMASKTSLSTTGKHNHTDDGEWQEF